MVPRQGPSFAGDVPMTRTTKKLLDEFAEAARCWGVEQEWGVGSSVMRAEDSYNAAQGKAGQAFT
jgi:hypothetical protein